MRSDRARQLRRPGHRGRRHVRRRRWLLLFAAAAAFLVAAVAIGISSRPSEPKLAIPTDSDPAEDRTPSTPDAARPEATQTVEASEFGITLEVPASWIESFDGTTSRSWSSDEGWAEVSAADALDGLDGVLDDLANHRLKLFGGAPSITDMVIDGSAARLILPSSDAPQSQGFPEGAVLLEVETDVAIAGHRFGVLTVFASADHIEAIASSIRFLEQPALDDDGGPRPTALATSPDGQFSYLALYATGTEHNGTLLVDNGVTVRPALRDPRDEFDRLGSVAFGPGGLITWQSLDENYGWKAFVGRLDAGGQIIDSHELPGYPQITGPGTFDDAGVFSIATHNGPRYELDTATDPFFVMSATTPPAIATARPLVPVLENEGYWSVEPIGSWYVGATLGPDPACGATTLYKDDPDGYARVLDRTIELDTVTDVDVSDAFSDGGADTVGGGRAVAISTECAAEYQGRRVFWGFESVSYGDGGPRFEQPLVVAPLDLEPVESVNSVTSVFPDEDCCGSAIQVLLEVTHLDGRQEVLTIDR